MLVYRDLTPPSPSILHFAAVVGFQQIFDEEVAFSRLSTPNHENHLHHDPPMGTTDGLNRSIWGVEAISHKITVENHILRQVSDFRPILDEEVAFSRTRPSNHVCHIHHDPPTDQTERPNAHIWGWKQYLAREWRKTSFCGDPTNFSHFGRGTCDLSPPDKNLAQKVISDCTQGPW